MCKNKYHHHHSHGHCECCGSKRYPRSGKKYYNIDDLEFKYDVGGDASSKLVFPNGFGICVTMNQGKRLVDIKVFDASEPGIARSFVDLFPKLVDEREYLYQACDTLIISETLKKVQKLTENDLKDFRK